jgi:outer membrane protein
MNRTTTAFVLGALLIPAAVFAQVTPPPQTKPTPPPAAQTPATQAPKPPALVIPFPEGAKTAFVNIAFIAAESVMGKAASSDMNTLRDKKAAEINSKNVQLKALQDKQASGGLLNDVAKGQLTKDIDKLNMEIQYANQTAQKELDDKNADLMNDFLAKLQPVIEAYAKEKGIDFVLTQDSAAIYVRAGLDISPDIVKRLDAIKK